MKPKLFMLLAMYMMTQNEEDLNLESYNYDLPHSLVAQRPLNKRDDSKLLVYLQKSDKIIHSTFQNIDHFLPDNSQLVFNQTKVFPCRALGKKRTGGHCEVFFLSPKPRRDKILAMIKGNSKKHLGDIFFLNDSDISLKILKRDPTNIFLVQVSGDLESYLKKDGLVPIPPYIRDGVSDLQDKIDYQTVYAKESGSVAAPTAGLHFTNELCDYLRTKYTLSYLTLHVGLGTFLPIKAENILNHKMHSEIFSIEEEELKKINNKSSSIIAVGTTTLRALESSFEERQLSEFQTNQWHETDIFLHPGKKIDSVRGLITNFHLPKSSLMMLVSSLVGRKKLFKIYQEAIDNKYRFYSYGDAMLLLRDQ